MLCCGLVPCRNRPWWNPRRLGRSPNECWLAWDQETKRKKAQRKVGFFGVFVFQTPKEKRRAPAKKCRERVEYAAMWVSWCAEPAGWNGQLHSVFAEAPSLCRQKDKKTKRGWCQKVLDTKDQTTEGLIPGSRKIIDQEGVRKRESKTEEQSPVSSTWAGRVSWPSTWSCTPSRSRPWDPSCTNRPLGTRCRTRDRARPGQASQAG